MSRGIVNPFSRLPVNRWIPACFQEQPLLYDWKSVQVESRAWLTPAMLAGLFFVISGLMLGRYAVGDPEGLFFLKLSAVWYVALIISPISWTHY